MKNWKFSRLFDVQQSVEISEKDGYRYLHLGSKTVQSAMLIKSPNELVLSYTKAMMGFLLLREEPKKVLMIGLGGGSLPKYFYHHIPGSDVTVIENNQEVLTVAKRYFDVPENNERFKIIVQDGVVWLQGNTNHFDVIMVDGYDESSQVESLATEKFYFALWGALGRDGVLVINSWTKEGRLSRNISNLRSSFPEIIIIPAERKGNAAILAFKEAVRWPPNRDLQSRAHFLEKKYALDFGRMLTSLKEENQYRDK